MMNQIMYGIHHTGFSVPNLEEALAFYCDVLEGVQIGEISGWEPGMELADEILQVPNVGGRQCWVKFGKAYLEVFEFSNCRPQEKSRDEPVVNHGFSHVAFIVDSLDDWCEKLDKKGVRFHRREPVAPGNGSRYVYLRDPFNNVVELIEVYEDGYSIPSNYTEELLNRRGISPG